MKKHPWEVDPWEPWLTHNPSLLAILTFAYLRVRNDPSRATSALAMLSKRENGEVSPRSVAHLLALMELPGGHLNEWPWFNTVGIPHLDRIRVPGDTEFRDHRPQ